MKLEKVVREIKKGGIVLAKKNELNIASNLKITLDHKLRFLICLY